MWRIGLIILAVVWSHNAGAQESPSLNEDDPRFVGGVAVGGNLTHITNDSFDGIHRFGPNVGGIVYARIKGEFWSSLEIRYSRKGTIGVRTDSSIAHASLYFTQYLLRLDYVEVPFALHVFNRRFYHFTAGVTYSYLLSSSELYSSLQLYRVDDKQFPFRQHNFDYLLGGGLHVNRNLFLNIHYQGSIVPIRDAWNVPIELGTKSQRNRMITLQLLYMFRWRKDY
ncbi:MAG: hypothetical protein K0R82_2404 [Flavipsychrobacter sp.]|jgi:hypothetical protein|nr:hypothetical protein [Flavipsychrobacter sp.]